MQPTQSTTHVKSAARPFRAIRAEDAGLVRIEPGTCDRDPTLPPWPTPLGPRARVGLIGDIVEAIEPTTEADPNAILFQLLAALGNLLGGGPALEIDRKRHALRIWVLIVGSTASGKKGTGAQRVFSLLDSIDPTWSLRRKAGIASGEAIVHHVRDSVERKKRTRDGVGATRETAEIEPGEDDKRLFLLEEEFSRVLRLAKRPGSTLSATIREAWDSDVLMTTSKSAPQRATGAHVTVVGHITPEELRVELSSTQISGGLANRFLFASSRRSRDLPWPPPVDPRVEQDLIARLGAVRAFVHEAQVDGSLQRMALESAAFDLWPEIKREVEGAIERAEAAGLELVKVLTRGAPYVLRIASLYAVAARRWEIAAEDLHAAREVWRYSVESARSIFGDEVRHPDSQKVLEALAEARASRMTRSEVAALFHRNRPAADLTRLRDRLIRAGRIEAFLEQPETGKKTEWWCGR